VGTPSATTSIADEGAGIMSQTREPTVVIVKPEDTSIDTIEVNAIGLVCELMYAVPLIIRQIDSEKRKGAEANRYNFSLIMGHLTYVLQRLYKCVFDIAGKIPDKRSAITVAECAIFELESLKRWINMLVPIYGDSSVDVVYNDETRYQIYTPSFALRLCDELKQYLDTILSEKTRAYIETASTPSAPKCLQLESKERNNANA
jgi:hypothetical protein